MEEEGGGKQRPFLGSFHLRSRGTAKSCGLLVIESGLSLTLSGHLDKQCSLPRHRATTPRTLCTAGRRASPPHIHARPCRGGRRRSRDIRSSHCSGRRERENANGTKSYVVHCKSKCERNADKRCGKSCTDDEDAENSHTQLRRTPSHTGDVSNQRRVRGEHPRGCPGGGQKQTSPPPLPSLPSNSVTHARSRPKTKTHSAYKNLPSMH